MQFLDSLLQNTLPFSQSNFLLCLNKSMSTQENLSIFQTFLFSFPKFIDTIPSEYAKICQNSIYDIKTYISMNLMR